MRTLNIALFAGLVAMVGCGDDPEQSLNGVFPSSGFIGRKVRVEVSGDNASFADGLSLDFGPGVTVSNVAVASPTAVFAELTIADTAALGTRDVMVHQGSDMLTLKQAFKLESPVAVELKGSLAQGSVVSFTATNLDLTNLYDTTCGVSFLGLCLQYAGMNVETPAGITAVINSVEPFRMSGTLFIDTDAQGGDLKFVSGLPDAPDKQVTSAIGEKTEVAVREAVALPASTPTTTTVAASFDSHLYTFDAAAASVSRFALSAGDPDASPTVYILPASGHFADLVTSGAKPNVVSETAGKYFAIYADGSGLSGYSYTIRVNPLTLSAMPESDVSGANNLSANAQNGGTNTSLLLTSASLSSGDDVDWVRFSVPSGSGAKKVHVMTTGSDPYTDTVVEVYKSAEDPAKLLGESDDAGYHEDLVTSAISDTTATVIFVKIYASSYFQASHSQYVAAIWLE
ncbi:MAG TPA: hypothetical protein VIV40_40940 [Kofleriaceae bacterium]